MDTRIGAEADEPSGSAESGAQDSPFAPVAPPPQPPAAPATAQFPPAPPLPPYPGQGRPGQGYHQQGYPQQAWPGTGQMPGDPYGYPSYGYGYPEPPRGTNGMAIAALVLGICGFAVVTPIIGLILGLVALTTVRRTRQKGKGLAISGIVLSGAWIALFGVLLTVATVNQPEPPNRDASGRVVGKGQESVFGLHPQDCFTLPPGLLGSTDSHIKTFTVVPCSTPHDSEAVGTYTVDQDVYPGADELRTDGTAHCLELLDAYAPDQAALTGSRVEFVYPDDQAWSAGERRVLCFLQSAAGKVTGSKHRDRSSYTADQLGYLDAVRPLLDTTSRLDALPASAPLSDLEDRAANVATALRGEIDALTSGQWPADVQPAVDACVARHRAAIDLMTQAADATDVTSFRDAFRQAQADFDVTDMNAIRTGLGLSAITAASGGSPASPDQAA